MDNPFPGNNHSPRVPTTPEALIGITAGVARNVLNAHAAIDRLADQSLRSRSIGSRTGSAYVRTLLGAAEMGKRGVTAVHTTRPLPGVGVGECDSVVRACDPSIRVDDEDLAVMAASGCSIVHKPVSKLKRGSGVMPFRRIRDVGINVCLGLMRRT